MNDLSIALNEFGVWIVVAQPASHPHGAAAPVIDPQGALITGRQQGSQGAANPVLLPHPQELHFGAQPLATGTPPIAHPQGVGLHPQPRPNGAAAPVL